MLTETKLIKTNFNQAASTYLAHAEIQVSAARKLIAAIPEDYHQGYILDLGSGPGTLAHVPTTTYKTINFDLSLAMLKTNKQKFRICGDAHRLPFASNSFAVVISNLMVQWSADPARLWNEVKRVLAPGGCFLFTTLINPSLHELQHAWQKVDEHIHTIPFLTEGEYLQQLIHADFIITTTKTWHRTQYFASFAELVRQFKLTGTTLPKAQSKQGLGGRRQLKQLELAYEELRTALGLPLTYEYLLVNARKAPTL
jgi:malonyl-CoA O-methyltransferase